MARRRENSGTLLTADDWSTTWRCQCGYGNAGRERCLMCGAPAPDDAQGTTGLHAETDVIVPVTGPTAKAGRKATRTVYKLIGLNLLVQAVEFGILAAAGVEQADAIRISLFSGLGFYALTAAWVLARSAELGIRPALGRNRAVVGAAEGFIVGGVMALLLFAVLRLATGRPILDPTITLLTAQGSIASLLLGVVLIVIAAPVVEELVFRGFLAEALRDRGKKVAVLLSAVAFSLAHLRLSQFRYYVMMGALFALVYWRRGLVGSVAAHATFNGMLVVLAVAASHGPALEVTAANGVRVTFPPTYQVSEEAAGNDLAAMGPLGATMDFTHVDGPDVTAIDLATDLATGNVPFPSEIAVDYGTVDVIQLPAGSAVSVLADVQGEEGRLIALPRPGRLWIAVFRSDGSDRARDDFDAALQSWRLPPV